MPTKKASTCLFWLLCSEFFPGRGNGWESPDTLTALGIDHAPSANPEDPVPAGLRKEDALLVRELINAACDRDIKNRLLFIDADTSDASLAKHRLAWRKWYLKMTPKINNAVDKVLSELDCLPKQMLHQQDDDTFPELVNLITLALNQASKELLGNYSCNGPFLANPAQPVFKMFLAQTYARHKRSWKRAMTALHGKDPMATDAGLWPALKKIMKSTSFLGIICIY